MDHAKQSVQQKNGNKLKEAVPSRSRFLRSSRSSRVLLPERGRAHFTAPPSLSESLHAGPITFPPLAPRCLNRTSDLRGIAFEEILAFELTLPSRRSCIALYRRPAELPAKRHVVHILSAALLLFHSERSVGAVQEEVEDAVVEGKMVATEQFQGGKTIAIYFLEWRAGLRASGYLC
ncbi:hypothetical protein NMY22_g17459 [Coprinellus aureogranulatus]|nr:hypothetical protein NMY22_g17459 [Coprinellus aureogranulatus]